MDANLKNKISSLPPGPGVYIFRDALGNILYIGKANSLKKRVQSYFNRALDAKTQKLLSKAADLDYRLVPSEVNASILEAALIKDIQPPYNIDLKDDKSFPWIKISDEEFPAVSICRRRINNRPDYASYFGPYTNVKLLRQAFKLMRQAFGFRSCRRLPPRPCLYYRLKLCPGPCAGKISPKAYGRIIAQIKMFLSSQYEELIAALSTKMRQEAARRNFEAAARLRDQIGALSAFSYHPARGCPCGELEELKELLRLRQLPLRIEAFDISNISGRQATGSMVSFFRGQPDKDNYRRFRIKSVQGINDYEMLKEIVRRRYSRLVREKSALPQLVLIDGGKAHLFAAAAEIEKLGLRLDIAAIAKQRENIYILGRKTPLRPRRDSAALNIIRRIRDEAHRFALKYHCLLRRKKIIGESARLSSGGIGGYEEKKRALKKSKNMQSSLITVIKK